MTDLAKISIEATDRTGPAVTSARAGLDSLSGTALNVRNALGAIGVAGVLSGFAAMTARAFEAADQMEKMAQKVGIPVAELSKLKWAASQADVSFEALGKGIKGLSKNMVEANDTTSKSGKLMAALGVDLSAGVGPAMESIAAKFARMPDGITKSTLAVELFGKAGLEMIPLLNGGAAGLRKMKEEAARLGLVMDESTTKAAEQFNDNLKVLRARSEALGISVTNSMAPGLVRITEAMKLASTESGVLRTLWIGLGGIASEFIGLNDSELVKTGIRIRQIGDEIEHLKNIGTRELGGGLVDRGATVRVEILRKELRLIEQLRTAQQGGFDDQVARRARQGQAVAGAVDSGLEARLKAILSARDGGDKISAYATAIDDANKRVASSYAETLDPLSSLTSAEKKLAELRGSAVWQEFTTQQRITLRVTLEHAVANEKLTGTQKEALKTIAEHNKFADDFRKKQEDDIAVIGDKATAINEEVANYGKLPSAIMEATVALNEQVLAQARQNDASPETIAYLEKLIAAQKKYGAALNNKDVFEKATTQIKNEAIEQARIWESAAGAAGDFFGDLIVNGRSAFDNLRGSLKSLAQELLAFFSKRYLLQMVAGSSGTFGAANATAAQTALGGSSGSLLGSAGSSFIGGAMGQGLGYLGGALGSTSLSILGTNLAGTAVGTIAGGGMTVAGSATGMGAIGGAGMGQGMMAAFASNPVGWIALAAIAAYAIFAQKAGGDKIGGSFQGRFDANGALTGTDQAHLFGLRPEESTGNAATQSLATTTAAAYFAITKKLGGTAQGLTFGLGYDSDPRGTAENRITALVKNAAGTDIFRESGRGIGRDGDKIGPEMQLSASRALLAAIQANDMGDKIIDAMFDDVNASSATQQQIDDVISRALAWKEMLGSVGAAFTDAAPPVKTAIEQIHEQGAALAEFARASDRSAKSLADLTTATAQYRARVTELLREYDSAKGAIAQTIEEAIRGFRFGVLDSAGQYSFLQNEAEGLKGTIANLTDAGAIADIIAKIAGLSGQAFGLLDGGEKKARLEEFVSGLQETQKVADTRLADLRQAATDEANRQLEETRKISLMDRETAGINLQAAQLQVEAARLNSTTALQGITINAGTGVAEEFGS